MKQLTSIAAAFLMLLCLQAKSQDAAPKGFVKGSVTLADNTQVDGFIKDDIRSKAAVVLATGTGNNKTTYDGDKLNRVTIEGITYLCMKGDFFKLVCDGELCFLQKISNAASKPVYVGGEAMFINGTEGKPGDYFIFNKTQRQLKLVTNKNITEVSAQSFVNCEAAISKAKEATSNVAMLKDAVVIFNNRNK